MYNRNSLRSIITPPFLPVGAYNVPLKKITSIDSFQGVIGTDGVFRRFNQNYN